mmetsp:Transcript_5619/g.16672  ORF Transcript_5619/g.16672 Transcript_5619/m.16672 type:complete len:103 (+) Transcript_5619:631-939(+)
MFMLILAQEMPISIFILVSVQEVKHGYDRWLDASPLVTPAKLINSTRTCNDQRPQQSLVEPNRTQWHGCKRTQAVHIWNFTIDKDRREIAGIGVALKQAVIE